MSAIAIRFRVEGALVVLQVLERGDPRHGWERDGTWRDAKVEDMLDVACFTRNNASLESQVEHLSQRLQQMERANAELVSQGMEAA